MRKKNPNDVVDAFDNELDKSLQLWADLREKTGEQGDLAKRVTVEAFMRAAISTETFLSDWYIAAVHRDATAFRQYLAGSVEQSVKTKWPALDKKVTIDLPKHPDLQTVARLLDPDGQNVTFATYERFEERARQQLCDPYKAQVIAMPGDLREAYLAVHKIRNLIAHGSQRAANEMNDMLANIGDARLQRGANKVQLSGIGAHLNADVGGRRRVELYHALMRALAAALKC